MTGSVYGSNPRRGALLTAAAGFFGAAFLIPYKHTSLLAGASAAAMALLLCSALWNTGTAFVQLGRKWKMDAVAWRSAVILAALSAGGNLCSARALTLIDPGLQSVLLRFQLVFVVLMGAVFLRETITRALAFGVVLAAAGVVITRYPLEGIDSFTGVFWGLGASLCFGTMSLVIRHVVARIEPVAVNAVRLWISVAILAVLPGTVSSLADAPPQIWLYAAAAAFCGPYLSRLFIMYSLRHMTVGLHTLLSLAAPIIAYILGYLAFGAVPTRFELIGIAIILVGIAVPTIAAFRATR